MSSSILEDAVAGRAKIVPWTVEQYHFAIDNGFIPGDAAVELIDGFIVHKDRAKAGEDPMTIGDKHALVVQRLVRLAPRFDSLGAHLRIQQAIALPPNNEPEPDGCVVRGSEEDYADRSPAAADVSCVIEISDSSLSRDLGAKLRNYASARIPQYIVADLVHDRVLVHEQPSGSSCSRVTELKRGQIVQISAGSGQVALAVDRLLP
jgi:Uma2 family endonuclease